MRLVENSGAKIDLDEQAKASLYSSRWARAGLSNFPRPYAQDMRSGEMRISDPDGYAILV